MNIPSSRILLVALAIVAINASASRSQSVHAPDLGAPVDTTLKALPDEANGSPAVSQVQALEEQRKKAMVAADVKTLETIIADDATYVHSTGIMQKRDELLQALANKSIRYISFNIEKTSYRVYGDAVVGTGMQEIKVMQGTNSRVIKSRYTVVYADRNGSLQLVAYQATALPVATTPKK
jgi:ketosteroid isomerase-like protein